jgi:glycosidase
MPRLLLAVLFIGLPAPAKPTVTKVEPPNWWMGLNMKTVRLLIRGSQLNGVRVLPTDHGLSVGRARANEAGTYVFVDVTVLSAGSHPLRLVTPSGSTQAPFVVSPPPARAGRFQGFSSDDFIYEIMPDRFSDGDPSNDDPGVSKGLFDRRKPHFYHGGDFQGIIDHLPYLQDLGVTALWITPIYDNSNRLNELELDHGQPVTDYHGYGAIDFYGVEEHFGTLEKFQELVKRGHDIGVKTILDMVANHCGPYHPWVTDPPTPSWFHGTRDHHLKETWQTWTLISPLATAALRRPVLDGWFAGILPDLNQDDPEVERYLIQNTLWWIATTGIDGIREDTLIYVPRRFWRDWIAAIQRDFPHVRVVGEVFDGDPSVTSFFQGGHTEFDGIDTGVGSVFDFPQYFAIRNAFAQGGSIEGVASVLAHDFLYPHPDSLVTFLGLHDVPRFMNEPGATFDGLRLAFTHLLASRGIPMIYSGDEIGMTGGADPDNRRDFPGGWTEDKKNAFEPDGRTADEYTLFAHIRRVAGLRQQLPALRRGGMLMLAANEDMLAYARLDGSRSVMVVLNNGKKPGELAIELAGTPFHEGDVLRDSLGTGPDLPVLKNEVKVKLDPRSAALYSVSK